MNVPPCVSKAKSIKPEPGEVTSPPHSSNKKDDGIKRERESQDMNDSDEEEEDEEDEEEEGDLLEEEEVGWDVSYFMFCNESPVKRHVAISFKPFPVLQKESLKTKLSDGLISVRL